VGGAHEPCRVLIVGDPHRGGIDAVAFQPGAIVVEIGADRAHQDRVEAQVSHGEANIGGNSAAPDLQIVHEERQRQAFQLVGDDPLGEPSGEIHQMVGSDRAGDGDPHVRASFLCFVVRLIQPRAASLSAAARSVRSHGRSRSRRPKWPYAAVSAYIGRSKSRSRVIAAGRRSNTSLIARLIASWETASVPKVSTLMLTGAARPIAYATWISAFSASPAATTFLATHRVA